jgi:hypothetical protein
MASRSGGSGIVLDLSANGAKTVVAAPGSSQTFTLPAPKLAANGNYPRACRIVVRVRGVVDNNGEGDAAVDWSDLARIVRSFETQCPLYGTIHKADTFKGPVAKHVAEFLSCGYNYYGGVGNGIAAGDGAAPFDISFALPFSHEAFFSPLDFAPWVGWLAQLQLTINLAGSDVFDVIGAGPIAGNLTVTAWIEAVPTKTLELPSVNQFRAYVPPAAGGGQALLNNVGQAGGLSCVQPGSRLAGLLEMMAASGMGGPSTTDEDLYTQFSADQLNQPLTNNLKSFIAQYQMLRRQSVVGGRVTVGTTSEPNTAGNPYNEAGELMFYPWRVPGADAEIGSQQKFMGNLTLDRTFTADPNSGEFVIITNEIRQLSEDSVGAFLTAASVSPDRVAGMKRAYYDGNPGNGRSQFAIPLRVPNKAA